MSTRRSYLCPVDVPMSIVGGKWKLILLFYILQAPRRNGELRRLISFITQKMLTQQLRELETDGLIDRDVANLVPPQVTYSVVECERARLRKVMNVLCDWGIYWADKTDADVEAFATLRHQPTRMRRTS
jgi:DNA-binding HxlR family transcriptional regulator